MLRFTKMGATFYAIDEDLAVFRMGGISQSADKKRLEEMKYAMRINGRNGFCTAIFITYIKLRTAIRNLLNMISPDLKSLIVTKKFNNA